MRRVNAAGVFDLAMVSRAEKWRKGITARCDSPFTILKPPSTIPAVTRRRRSRFSAILRLWPMAAALFLIAGTVGYFWLIAHELRFERQPLPADSPAKK